MSSYPVRRSTRLRDYEYSQAGGYFVTLCTEGRRPLFGRIVDAEMWLSPSGDMVSRIWSGLGTLYPGVEIDDYVVMPNHVHGIIMLSGEVPAGEARAPGASSPQPLSLSTVVQRFKSFTTHEYGTGVAREGWPRYDRRLWQHRFHEHVIRNERDLAAIRAYIAHNPLQWHLDRENPERRARNV